MVKNYPFKNCRFFVEVTHLDLKIFKNICNYSLHLLIICKVETDLNIYLQNNGIGMGTSYSSPAVNSF